MSVSTVGFVGVGRLGFPLAAALVGAGHTVVCPARGRSDELTARGATIAGDGTPRAVADVADVVFTCLASADALEEAVFGPAGLAAANQPLKLIDLSTIPIDLKQRIRDRLAEAGGELLDAPVSGTPPMAAAKIAVVYGSGDQALYQEVEHLITDMAPNSVYVGEFGTGTKMKLVAQFLATIHVTATAQAMVFAKLAGLDLGTVANVIAASPGAVSGQFQIRAPMIAKGQFDGQLVTVETMLKDVDAILDYAAEVGAPTDLVSIVGERYHKLAADGEGASEPGKLFLKLLEEAAAR